jgi:AcrR family transcriptional regulator
MYRQQRSIDKHQRLLKAAETVVHRQGYRLTTLTDVAREARVAVGGIYYYFPTKETMVEQIINARMTELTRRMKGWERDHPPLARLEALVDVWREDSEIDARYGCPIGSLCYELSRAGARMAEQAARPLQLLREWSERQFRILGTTDPDGAAEHLVMALQGASLVGNAFHDPGAIVRETERLKTWLAYRVTN